MPPCGSAALTARYAEVAVDAHTGKPGGAFTYSIPPHLDLQPGCLVRVPFGPRTLHGIVVALRDTTDAGYAKPVESLVEQTPLLTPERIALAEWIADYYMAPLYDALALMLPPDLRSRSHTYVKFAKEPADPDRLSRGAQRLLAYLRSEPRQRRVSSLVRTLGPWARNAVRALVESGAAVEWQSSVEPRPMGARPRSARRKQALVAAQPAALRAHAAGHPRARKQTALIDEMLKGNPLDATDARKRFGPAVVAALIAAGLAKLEDASAAPSPPKPSLLPTAQQQRALAAINAGLDDPDSNPRVWLLHGVTGSGKTEVYLQSIAHCLATGRRAIVLVPELALTPQALERFEARFPGRVGVLHSALSPTRRAEEWRRVSHGERDVVIGPRSALFAPIDNLGLIVLDEEHEWTYKQDDASPRYHARDVAERLAALTGAVVVLGSATPDLATAYRAQRGEIGKLELPDRLERSGATAGLARVEVVDMREELRDGNRGIFSRLLRDYLQETLAARRQAVLFLNRRGAASVVECRSCGSVMRCSRCSTPLTYHRLASAPGASSVTPAPTSVTPAPIRHSRAGGNLAAIPSVAASIIPPSSAGEDRRGPSAEKSPSVTPAPIRHSRAGGNLAAISSVAASIIPPPSAGEDRRGPSAEKSLTPVIPAKAGTQGTQGGSEDGLLCHHCGRRRGVPSRCPRCKSDRIRYLGIGAQRVAEEVAILAPEARVLRWDSDAVTNAGAHERLLKTFADGDADVLVGTQMVAKGLDIPSVDLVGVVLADIGLHMPDFRAPERAFQLLTQVAGRAGRGREPGRAVIQTYLPDHYAIQTAAAQDYSAFYEAEIERRRIHGNPPVNKLVRLLYAHSDQKAAAVEASRFGGLLRRVRREWDMSEVEIVGPAPAYPPRVRNAWRWHIIVRAPEPRSLLDKVGIPPAWRVDVDPVSVV